MSARRHVIYNMLHPSFECLLNTSTFTPQAPVKKRRAKKVKDATSDQASKLSTPSTLGQNFIRTPIKMDSDMQLTTQKTLTVARFGRIYKRKCPSKKLGFIPPVCQPGHRFCRVCNGQQPISAFYTNIKRYICKRHHYERVRSRFKARMAPPDAAPERNAENAWLDLNVFSKVLGYKKLCYDRHDIMDLIRNTGIPLELFPRAVPIDTMIPMRPRNVAIIRRKDFNILERVYELVCSPTVYTMMVQSFNLLPPNADAGSPWDPFHNPTYIRQDCDVTRILHAEQQHAPDRPVYDAVMALREQLTQSHAAALIGSNLCDTPDSSSTQNLTTHHEAQ